MHTISSNKRNGCINDKYSLKQKVAKYDNKDKQIIIDKILAQRPDLNKDDIIFADTDGVFIRKSKQ